MPGEPSRLTWRCETSEVSTARRRIVRRSASIVVETAVVGDVPDCIGRGPSAGSTKSTLHCRRPTKKCTRLCEAEFVCFDWLFSVAFFHSFLFTRGEKVMQEEEKTGRCGFTPGARALVGSRRLSLIKYVLRYAPPISTKLTRHFPTRFLVPLRPHDPTCLHTEWERQNMLLACFQLQKPFLNQNMRSFG